MSSAHAFAYIKAKRKDEALHAWKDAIMNLPTGKRLRVPAAGLRVFLLRTCEPYVFDGSVRIFHKKSLGLGIYEVWFEATT